MKRNLFIALVLAATPAFAQVVCQYPPYVPTPGYNGPWWVSVGFSPRFGYSSASAHSYANYVDAQNDAVAQCNQVVWNSTGNYGDCVAVATSSTCAAVAVGPFNPYTGRYPNGWSTQSYGAQWSALAECGRLSGGCISGATVCLPGYRP